MESFATGLPLAGVTVAALFVAIGLWEHGRPERSVDQGARSRWIANLGLYAISEGSRIALAPLLAMLTAAASVAPLSHVEGFSFLHLAGLHLAGTVLVLDLAFYALHRLMHALVPLWRLHAIHHTDLALDVSTTVRHHPLEAIVIAAMVVTVGALIGAAPGEIAAYGVLAFAVQLLAHANVALPRRFAKVLQYAVVTPDFHRLHHSRDPREHHANYGQVFTVWDRLFRTGRMPDGDPVAQYGVAAYAASESQRLGAMLLQPVRPLPKQA